MDRMSECRGAHGRAGATFADFCLVSHSPEAFSILSAIENEGE